MGRGYWLPPQHDELAASDGFFLDGKAVYTDEPNADWEKFLESLCRKLTFQEKTFKKLCNWKACGMGQSYFVLVHNKQVEIIAEDTDGYIAVYAIIPEDCEAPGFAKRSFPKYITLLFNTLTEMYPGAVYKRTNSRKLTLVG